MIVQAAETGIAPAALGAAFWKVANLLAVTYTVAEVMKWEDDQPIEEGDPICTTPLTNAARTYWAEQTANYKAAVDAKIADPHIANVAKARIDELIEAIKNDPAWTLCETSAQSRVLWDMIERLEAMNPPGTMHIDPDVDPLTTENGAPEPQSPAKIAAGVFLVGALLFAWSRFA